MPPIHRGIDSHASNAQDGPSDDLGNPWWWHPAHGYPGQKYANASGSRRRMAPLSRSDPVLRFVRSRQRFVHLRQATAAMRSQGSRFRIDGLIVLNSR